jgi:putative ABC transport system permease protein
MFSRWLIRLRALFHNEDVEAEFDEELRYHFDREVECNVARGMSHEEAQRAARRAFGDPGRVKEDARETWRWKWLDDRAQDVAFTLRTLRRAPGFTAVVVGTLALGIGANTAVFSVVRSVLLEPLPYPDDEQLAVVWHRAPRFNAREFHTSPPEYVAYRDQGESWDELAAFLVSAATATGDGEQPERFPVAFTTWNLFPALGVEPLLGRTFTADEDKDGLRDVAVLSHQRWISRYGGEREVLGKTIMLDGVPRTVVGVMPAEFRFPNPDVRVWLPLALTEGQMLYSRGNHALSLVGRVRRGSSLAAAEAELAALTARWVGDGVDVHTWHPTYLRSLLTEVVGDVSRTLWVMLGAVALVLLIACANVASLLLVRAEGRVREMSLRTALGAGRRRLMSQLLTESLVVAAAGGLAGVALAYLGVDALRAITPADLPRLDEITVDAAVLGFTLLVTVSAGILFGLVPALHAGRADLHSALREEGRTGTPSRKRIRVRQLVVVSETALAVVLLVAAGLLLQSFRRLMAVDPGFRTERVLTATVTIPRASYSRPEEVVGFYESLLPPIASLPGVTAAGAATQAPLAGGLVQHDIEIEGGMDAAGGPVPIADLQVVTPGYFEAMGIPLLEGRSFERGDGTAAPLVAVVSEDLARGFWPGRSAIGGGIRLSGRDERHARVVGVVPEVRQARLDRPAPRGTLYLAHAQTPYTWVPIRSMTLTVRSSIEPTSLVSAIRRELQAIDPSVPLYGVRTMEQAVADTTATRRFSMLLQLLFALVALSLAAVGLYGVVAFTVACRTPELGIRMALGAKESQVRRMVVGQGMGIVAIALALGLGGAFVAGRLLRGLLFGVSPDDPVIYSTVAGVLLAVALLACWIPARRASRVHPAEALRAE